MRTDRVIAMRVALQAFQLNSSSRNISWLTYLALSIVVTEQIKESSLPFCQTILESMRICLSLFGRQKDGGMKSWGSLLPVRDFDLRGHGSIGRVRLKIKVHALLFPTLLFSFRVLPLSRKIFPEQQVTPGVKTQRWMLWREVRELVPGAPAPLGSHNPLLLASQILLGTSSLLRLSCTALIAVHALRSSLILFWLSLTRPSFPGLPLGNLCQSRY